MKMKYIPEEHDKYKNRNGNFYIRGRLYYSKICKNCEELGLMLKSSVFCSVDCANSGKQYSEDARKKISETHKGKELSYEHKKNLSRAMLGNKNSLGYKHSEEYKKNISDRMKGENHYYYGKKLSEETRKKMSEVRKGEKHHNWKGGILDTISMYDTYAYQLKRYEEIRETEEGYLEVRCTYCGKWYIPNRNSVRHRINAINGTGTGECRLYCSDGCKQECPIYNKSYLSLIKEDAIRAGLIEPDDYNREVQPELRKLVLARDNYTCQICGSTHNLHCHHYVGIWQDQLESADMDNCVTLCRNCHIYKAHSQPGCRFVDMRRKVC
jgi:hypothetical protein